MNNILLLALNIIFLVSGQTLWKMASLGISGSFLRIFYTPYFLAGGILYVLATGIWVYLLSKLPLSYLYPLQSLAYVLGTIIACVIFKEVIPVTRWLGVCVIIFGAYLIAK
ncbi:hypothetical protein HZF08_33865 [Paenibacillus sp. CGMCC 1.16610]|uniref:EamA domain-containing protein n=1 Tax=Paenibacillus anseongense TaxID=2682845 RepID=A0ABW9U0X9_9BACL|nr:MULTISPECIES: hypothetical protein [Paenibacillus]MBA2943261.1 hypothetical protein [Paenibacillus sp. CGMCC 1.16610]MVQ33759.1 hypothetical protein [Paenibacillus anseongense]